MRILSHIAALVATLVLLAQPAAAQSVLRDAETEALLNDMTAPLAEAAGLDPKNVDIVLLNDPSINAFVAGGQRVYIHSGLIEAAQDAGEVQGVIAHELGHVTGGHIVRYSEGAGVANKISLLSLLVGVAAAAAGAGDAAMGLMMAGQRAALGKFLAFSRVQEASADAAGAEYLSGAGISGKGSLAFFGKLQSQEFRYGVSQDDDAAFTRTHPLSGDRIATLRESYLKDPAWERPTDPELQRRFLRARAKLIGYLSEPKRVIASYSGADVPSRYARAYALHREARVDEALQEAEALMAAEPDNPYFMELKGQILLESGCPAEALTPLRRATELTRNEPLIASIFGHALIATEDRANYDEATQVLKTSVARDRLNPFAWYQLGIIYAQQGDMPRARLASAEQQVMAGNYPEAIRSAGFAENGLERGSPDWLRAQDIGFEARAALEQARERR